MEGCDLVVHLGALISIPYSYRHPAEVVETNVIGTLNVLESARRVRVKRLICISSSEVYGTAQTVPMTEGHRLHAQSPYAASKIGADQLALSYHRCFDLPVAVVRPFNVYGPRQSARAVIPTIIAQALTQDRIHLGSLHPRRDFTFVRDTVNGLLLAASTEQAVGCEINLGSDDEISIGELAKKIMELVGRPVPIEHDDDRCRPAASEVDRLHADNTVARTVLGWRPTIDLEDGLRDTIAWIEKHLDRYPMAYRV
jgi:dTDP-glucose 4,6-dehydratase